MLLEYNENSEFNDCLVYINSPNFKRDNPNIIGELKSISTGFYQTTDFDNSNSNIRLNNSESRLYYIKEIVCLPKGKITVVLPNNEEVEIKDLVLLNGLLIKRIESIDDSKLTKINSYLLEF